MKIGVIGSGDVGKTLAGGFLKHGHEVMMGTREAGKLADWARQNRGGKVGTFAQTAQFGEVVVLAVKGTVASEALRGAGKENLAGAIEPLCMLWCIPGFLRNEWGHAFKLLKV